MTKVIHLNPLVFKGKDPELWAIANEVVDPEIPVLSVVDMGIVRDIEKKDDALEISITPTYTGCPAMDMIGKDLKTTFEEKGFKNVSVKLVLSPAWTTDWISEDAKERLRKYGIAPPPHSTSDKGALLGKPKEVKCPRCGSTHTTMISNFGSTACKALWKCQDCKEPFDYFKCI